MASNDRGAEGGHYYASQKAVDAGIAERVGEPVLKVPGKKGQPVNIRAEHVIQYGLGPGATTVCGMLAKPFLIDWAARITADAAVLDEDGNVDPEFSPAARLLSGNITLKEYKAVVDEVRRAASSKPADEGKVIHGWLERGFLGEELTSTALACFTQVKATLDSHYCGFAWKPELPFFHRWGFGGRTDALGLVPDGTDGYVCVVDFKTRDFTAEDLAKAEDGKARGLKDLGRLTPRDSEPMQIAANLIGHGHEDYIASGFYGGNLYIARKDPTLQFFKSYSSPELTQALAVFRALLTVWQVQRGITGGA